MLKDYKKLLKKRPLVAGIIGLSALYASYTAFSSSINGLGASTSTTSSSSTSHAMMNRTTSGDMMQHPTALYGYRNVGSHCSNPHCNTRSNPHCHCGGGGLGAGHKGRMKTMYGHEASDYGEDTHESSSQLFGVPNKIKRRVMMNDMNEGSDRYNDPRSGDIFSHAQPQQMSAEEAELLAGAGGWL